MLSVGQGHSDTRAEFVDWPSGTELLWCELHRPLAAIFTLHCISRGPAKEYSSCSRTARVADVSAFRLLQGSHGW